ncbi:hypothetical protein EDC01DRAFT_626563 [Geopyxis carbonaria]|nr:hypothetical protein EDC01DRAFT_626563 [Geopyxis carbonaria]
MSKKEEPGSSGTVIQPHDPECPCNYTKEHPRPPRYQQPRPPVSDYDNPAKEKKTKEPVPYDRTYQLLKRQWAARDSLTQGIYDRTPEPSVGFHLSGSSRTGSLMSSHCALAERDAYKPPHKERCWWGAETTTNDIIDQMNAGKGPFQVPISEWRVSRTTPVTAEKPGKEHVNNIAEEKQMGDGKREKSEPRVDISVFDINRRNKKKENES